MWGFISVDVNQQACALAIKLEDLQRGKTRSKCCSRLTGRMILVVGNETCLNYLRSMRVSNCKDKVD
jgi:hypothetical protein